MSELWNDLSEVETVDLWISPITLWIKYWQCTDNQRLPIHCQPFAHNVIYDGLIHNSTVSTITISGNILPDKGFRPLRRPEHLSGHTFKNRSFLKAGTAWTIFTPAAEQWGVTSTNIGKNQIQMQEALGNGKLVIASMGPGTFTKGGHFIVLTGVTGNGKITVNDPNDNSTKKHYDKAFDVSLIMRECKCMWVFGKD